MFVTIINDCNDSNVFGRQLTRAAVLFDAPAIPVGVYNELEAAGNLIDVLDSALGTDPKANGVILVNVAPRHGKAKKWPNGTPFGYFSVNNVLVVTSVDGLTLSLIKKLHILDTLQLLDIPTVLHQLEQNNVITKELEQHVTHTQFRSFEFIPRVAKWLLDKETIPSEQYKLSEVTDAPQAVWYIDNFGNCKTTILPEEIGFKDGERVTTKFGEIMCYNRLKDVPDQQIGLIIGSSGYKENRFVELVCQGKSAAKMLNLSSGTTLFE